MLTGRTQEPALSTVIFKNPTELVTRSSFLAVETSLRFNGVQQYDTHGTSSPPHWTKVWNGSPVVFNCGCKLHKSYVVSGIEVISVYQLPTSLGLRRGFILAVRMPIEEKPLKGV